MRILGYTPPSLLYREGVSPLKGKEVREAGYSFYGGQQIYDDAHLKGIDFYPSEVFKVSASS